MTEVVFYSRYTMYCHLFWCVFWKISVVAVALLAQYTKYSVTCWNIRKYGLWCHIWIYSSQ